MTFSIPISAAMRDALKDQSKRYIKISIIHNGETVSLYPTKLSGNVSEEYQSWNVQLKNYGEYTEGLFADDLVTVSFSHDGSDWITMMTGYVSPEGMTRENGYVSDDFVSFDLVDRTKGKGTRRKPSSTVFAALKICDPSDVSNSILHRLGSLMGISSFDVGLIQDAKDIVVLGEQVVWSELKLLRDAYKASMYFDHLGRLRFHSPLEIGWTDPESEWTFVADPLRVLDDSSSRVVGKVRRTYNQVSCNRAKTTLNLFEKRSKRLIYRDTTNWNSDLSQCSIVIQPGETYPESGVLSLSYKDPDTGEEYSYATNVQTPSIGQSKSYDICYTGGRLSLVSFNGSSAATTQQPDASQIILKNTGSLSCEIIKFEVKGEPFLKLSENNIEELDASVSDEVDYVDLSIDGKYATSVSQIDKVLARHVEEGKNRTRHFSFSTTFLPHIQREMRCTFVDVDGSETLCKITTYSHKQSGRTLDSMRTSIELDEVLSYTPTYNPKVVTKNPQPSVPVQGKPGDKMVIQFALGDDTGPFDTGWTLGQDDWEIGQDDWVVGQDTWVDNPPTPGEGQYVWQRVGYYNPSTETWPSDWKITRSTGLKGDPARAITLYADSTVINMSSRGELKTQEIEITCVPSNLPIESAVWTATDAGSLSEIEIAEGVYDPYKRLLNCSLVSGDSTLITVSIAYGGDTYTGVVGITKVADGTPTPMYLDARNEVPELTPEGPLVVGDFFLYVGTYSGQNSDPGDQGLNPPQAETNEFIYGRIYEYKGKDSGGVDQWDESRKSEHFSVAQKDALEIAKNSGVYLYAAVVVAQLGLFMDLIFAGSLMSADYIEYTSAQIGTVVDGHLVTEEDVALKRPYKGIYMDGNKGLIKLLSLMVKDIDAFGFLTSSGFRTLRGEDGQTIGVSTISPTLWKHSEMEALIPSQDTLATLSGTIEGFTFARATKRVNQRILQKSTGYEYEAISAGEEHFFTKLAPDIGWGYSFYTEYSGYYKGNFSYRRYLGADGSATGNLSESYSKAYTRSLRAAGDTFCCWHKSEALWDFGAKSSYVNDHKIWTSQTFYGLVLTSSPVHLGGIVGSGSDFYDFDYKVIEPEPSAYYSNSKTWTIGSYNQNSIDNYCSGTAFYNLFSGLAVGADGFCDGGQIRVNGTLYTVTRLTKNASSITFYTSGGVVTVNKFQEGTSVGVYTSLAVTQAINFQAVAGGIETKHIFPWGTQAGTPGSYDIGTSSERFNTAWLNYLDIKGKPPLLTKSLSGYPGLVHSDGTDSNWLRTPLNGLIPYASGGASALGSSAWPFNNGYFKNLNVAGPISGTTIDTGHGANEVYKITNEAITAYRTSVQMSTMDIGEIRFVYASLTSDSDGSPEGSVLLPAGGRYVVLNFEDRGISNITWYLRIQSSSPVGVPGGTKFVWNNNDQYTMVYALVRRIS